MGSSGNQRLILGGLVVLCGLGLWFILARTSAPTPTAPVDAPKVELPPATVVVAAEPLKFGDELAHRKLTILEWPRDSVPAGSFRTVDEILGGNQRRVALAAIEPSEPILKSRISGFGGRATLAQVIAPGMRAFTIRVNDVVGVAGLILPGDRVDLVLTRSQNGRRRGGGSISHGLMQNLRVLAVDQRVDGSGRSGAQSAKTVTLEVTPDGAQKLALATQIGTITLTLRNSGIDGGAELDDVTITRLSDLSPMEEQKKVAAAPKPAVAPGTEVVVIRGGKRVSQRVPESGVGGVTSYSAPPPPDGTGGRGVSSPIGGATQPANRASSSIDAGLLPKPSVQTWNGREN